MEIFLNVLKWSAAVGVAALAVLALKDPLDRRFSPKWRYWLWFVLAIALLASPARWERLIPSMPSPVAELKVPEVRLSLPEPRATDRTYSDAAGAAGATGTTGTAGTAGAAAAPRAAAGAAPTQSHVQTVPTKAPAENEPVPSAPSGVSLSEALTVLWLTGAGIFALWHVLATAWFARRARRWSVAAPAELTGLERELARELGVKAPELRMSRAVTSPLAMGLFRPTLYIPDGSVEPGEAELILRHELTHIKRRDLWYKLIMLAANALHWFDPLVWLMRRDAGETVELLCDGQAMAGTDDSVRRAYCEALLDNISRERSAALSTHFYGGAKSVKRRFHNLLSGKRRFGWTALTAGILAVAVTACAVGVGPGETQTEPPSGQGSGEGPSGQGSGEDPSQGGDKTDTPPATAPGGVDEPITGPGSGDLEPIYPEGTSEPMSEEELGEWEERLNSLEWNGFVADFYRCPQELDLYDVLYMGGGVSRELTPAEAALYGVSECPTYAFDRETLAAWVLEKTGVNLEEFDLSGFDTLPGYDALYMAHGDSNYGTVRVTGGQSFGDRKVMSVENESVPLSGFMTVEDGKIVSFTNTAYNVLAAAADGYMERVAAAVRGIVAVDARGKFGQRYLLDRLDGGYDVYRWNYELIALPFSGDLSLTDPKVDLIASPNGCREDGDNVTILRTLSDGSVETVSVLPARQAAKWMGHWREYLNLLADPDSEPAVSAVQALSDGLDGGYVAGMTWGGATTKYDVTPELALYAPDTLRSSLLGLGWTEADSSAVNTDSKSGASLTSADGRWGIWLNQAGGPVEMTLDGKSAFFGLGDADRQTLWDIVYGTVDNAAELSCTIGVSSPGDLFPDEVMERLAQGVAEKYRSLPEWVDWRPSGFEVSSFQVYDQYMGEPQQLCGVMTFFVKLDSDDPGGPRAHWEVGSGLGDKLTQGGHAGWYTVSMECRAVRSSGGDYVIDCSASGGCTVDIPGWSLSAGSASYLGDAPLSELLRLFIVTRGTTHDNVLPQMVLYKPIKELTALPEILSTMDQFDAQDICSTLYLALGKSPEATVKDARQLVSLLGDQAYLLGDLASVYG